MVSCVGLEVEEGVSDGEPLADDVWEGDPLEEDDWDAVLLGLAVALAEPDALRDVLLVCEGVAANTLTSQTCKKLFDGLSAR